MPHRGDRDMFLPQFYKCLDSQTLKPSRVEIIDYVPKNGDVDITPRYREGYERLRGKVDLIAFMEIDDFYRPEYLQTMASGWKANRCPDIFGTNYTIYYHVGIKKYFRFEHYGRASMMSTVIKPDLEINWPVDHDPYTDLHLWKNQKGWTKATFAPNKHITVGIKHGIGMCGGRMHIDHLYKYNNSDEDLSFLSAIVGESLDFYKSLLIP